MVNLGQASSYAALSGASIGNTVSAPGAPHTTLRGDMGVKPNAEPTGFPPGVVTGTTRIGTPAAAQAHANVVTAYNEVAARTGGAPLAAVLAGKTVSPGLYTITAAASNTGTLTLDAGGDPNAVFVFQVGAALSFAANSHVVLTNGAKASRVFWQVNGAGNVGADADFAGTLMAKDAVAFGANTLVNGRAFAITGAMGFDNNQLYSGPPALAITGGGAVQTTDTTPTISGTTDLEAPGTVAVAIAGQTLHATPTNGTWSVTSAILPNGTYPVVASASDAVGNTASDTQQLTVDTVLPVVTLDEQSATNDSTPTISGTSDAAVDTVVHVTVGSQNLRALVHAGGSWNIRAAVLADGDYTVTASVSDLAGNEGTDSQSLTVDTVAPPVTIAGGATALTNDPTPTISGTAGSTAGSTVTVNLADETLTGLTTAGGGWSVTAGALSDGAHRIVVSASDSAGNTDTETQMLTVDTVSPAVTIDGGATEKTNDLDPTITGTSNAAPGSTVTVTIAGQTMTTLIQADGDWNATPSFVGEGTWHVVASVSDPAGNAQSAEQSLKIVSGAPDTTPPQTTITTEPPDRSGTHRVIYEFASSERGSRFQCSIDKRPFTSCSSPEKIKFGRGVHRFKVRAIDHSGNVDPTPARDRFKIA
jgi:hypothetical protein